MKVLLIGEYSGVHADLATALRKQNIVVFTANNGDGFKNYSRDIDLKTEGKNKLHTLINVCRKFRLLLSYTRKYDFDIIQAINPKIFPRPLNRMFWNILFKKKAKIFLLACGEDAVVWKAYRSGCFRYYAFDGQLEQDMPKDAKPWEDDYWMNFISNVSEKISSIIPLCVEYKIAYEKYFGKLPFVPLSINCELPVTYDENKYNKIVIYHGVNIGREGAKGSHIILKALEKILIKYGSRVEITITYSIPFQEYLSVLRKSTIVVDQTSCYSVSMNSLYSMLSGCVVLGGGEPEYFKSIGVSSAPIINIIPDVNDIVEKISYLIENQSEIKRMGMESIEFVKKYHDTNKNVFKFLQIWKEYPVASQQ